MNAPARDVSSAEYHMSAWMVLAKSQSIFAMDPLHLFGKICLIVILKHWRLEFPKAKAQIVHIGMLFSCKVGLEESDSHAK